MAAPYGAYPHECYGRYGPDLKHFDAYVAAVKEDGPAAGLRYVEQNVDAHADFAGFLAARRAGPAGRAGGRRRGADAAVNGGPT